MPQKNPVIMLVDDDQDFVQINRHILEAKGYRVICCYDSQEALDRMDGEAPDLLISDLMMKSLDSGFTFCRQVRRDERFKNLPIVMATSVASQIGLDFHPRNAQDLSDMGVDAFLEKPIAPSVLLETVQTLLKSRQTD